MTAERLAEIRRTLATCGVLNVSEVNELFTAVEQLRGAVLILSQADEPEPYVPEVVLDEDGDPICTDTLLDAVLAWDAAADRMDPLAPYYRAIEVAVLRSQAGGGS